MPFTRHFDPGRCPGGTTVFTLFSKWWPGLRYPVVRQYEQADCGPAALLSVLRYWGGDASLVHVRALAGTDTRGTTMLALARAARALGMEARGARGTYEDLKLEELPCIAHVIAEDGSPHYLVVYVLDERSVIVGDPAHGITRLAREAFERRWCSRAVLLLSATDQLVRSPPPHWLHWISAYFDRERSWLIQCLFLGASASILGLATAVFIQWLIDRFIPDRDTTMILLTGLILLALLFLRAGAGYLQRRFLVGMNERVSVHVSDDFLAHLFRLPLHFFETRRTGDITSRIADGIRIQKALLEMIGTAVVDGLLVLGSLLFLFVLAPPLGPVALATIPLYGMILLRATRSLERGQRSVMASYAHAESSYIDSLEGIETVLASNASNTFTRLNTSLNRTFQGRKKRLELTEAAIGLFTELAGGMLIMASLIWGSWLVIQDALRLGQLVAGYSLLAGMLPSIHRLVRTNVVFQEASVAATRFQDLLLVPREGAEGSRTFAMTRGLHLRDAGFEWPSGEPLFREVNITISPGRLTGLWGPNGVGKSTLTRILNRSYPLSKGSLLVDRTPAAEIPLEEYRRQVALVPEDVKIFNGTLAHNVLLGRAETGSPERLRLPDAFDMKTIHARFTRGWRTRIGEGGRRISTGESQLVGLLRALIDQPRILLVDEGLQSADVEISRMILDTLREYAESHAVLIISHDLRVLLRTDYLYLLEGGTIRDHAPPSELFDRDPGFRELCASQLVSPPGLEQDRYHG